MANTKIPPELVADQVFGNRNVIINGEMQISQRDNQTGLGANATSYGPCDRFFSNSYATDGRFSVEQSTDTPDGFANSLKYSCTTADTSISAGEHIIIMQRIEGFNLQRFAKGTSSAKEFSVSFYVKGNAAATYVCELYDEANGRQISKTFAVTTAWNRIELTFPADTTGTLANSNASVMYIAFWIHAGSTYTSGTLNSSAWAAQTAANRAVGISSFVDSTNRTLFLTGVQIETGSQVTPFEHRSIGEVFDLCQRYFRTSRANGAYDYIMSTVQFETTVLGQLAYNHTGMRASPTVSSAGTMQFEAAGAGATLTSTSIGGDHYLRVTFTSAAAVAVRDTCNIRDAGSGDAVLDFDSEL